MINEQQVWRALAKVRDPEIPVLSVLDLGIVRTFKIESNEVTIQVTPTYSGCPALKVIEDGILETLRFEGLTSVKVERCFSPAWSSDWITAEGRKKLKEYGIAPPGPVETDPLVLIRPRISKAPPCPFCDSTNTELTSEFGSTACKAMNYCKSCQQPFESFKSH